MNLTHLGSELRRFGHGKLPPLAFVVITILPLLFGGLFVWSYWDPIGRINQLPIAFVNSDAGAQRDGQPVNAGDQITDKLAGSGQLNLHVVSPEEARDGVANGTYYFAMELPEDFSQAAVSAASDNPHQATLNTIYNNDNGLLGTTLGNQAVARVLDTMNDELGKQVTGNLLVGFNTIGQGMNQAGDGAKKLSDGATTAKDASGKLAEGAGTLEGGIGELDQGAKKLNSGATELDNGLGTAASSADQLADGLAQLNAATSQLGNGAAQVSGGVNQIESMASQATAAQQQIMAPLINISAQLRQTNIPAAVQLAGQVDGAIEQLRTQGLGPESELAGNLTRLSNGAAEIQRQLTDPAAQYLSGMNKAADGSQQLATGLHKLKDGSGQLVVGTQTLTEGTSKLVDGSHQLTVGANQLSSGLVKLDEGSSELSLKITDGAQKVPSFGDDKRDDYASTISTPVRQNSLADSLSLFGYGLAPVFISLGLFVGGIVTFMLIRPLQRRAVDSGMSPLRVILASYWPAFIVGVSQATIMFLVEKYALGLNANNELGMWLSMCATAATFQCIVMGINAFVGPTVGRVICMALMSLQMVSSGGLYPPETQPSFLRWFHTYDPMTYSCNLIREMIFHVDSSADGRMFEAMGALTLIFVLFLSLGMAGAWRARHWRMKDLHPEVAV